MLEPISQENKKYLERSSNAWLEENEVTIKLAGEVEKLNREYE